MVIENTAIIPPKSQTAGIAHENLCRKGIVPKKSDSGAYKAPAKSVIHQFREDTMFR